MTLDEYLETSGVTMNTLRSGLARCCKILGLSQNSCLGLTLLLNSRWQLTLMLAWMLQEEEAGRKPDTTEVVLMAEKIRQAWEKKQAKESLSRNSRNSVCSAGISRQSPS